MTIDLFFSVFTGDTCIVTYPDGTSRAKRLPIPYVTFARRILHGSSSRKWSASSGPGHFHFVRVA